MANTGSSFPVETGQARYWEIDLVRGIGVAAMIGFHLAWNLWYFGAVKWNILGTFSQSIARTIGSMFLSLVGVSLSISYQRARLHLSPTQLALKYIKRGLRLLGWGIVITIVTRLVINAPVYFGVLHLIGTATLLSIPFLPHAVLAATVGISVIVYTLLIPRLPYFSLWLLPLGLTEVRHPMSDYYPLFPWYGVVLLGVYLGQTTYPGGNRRVCLPPPRSRLARGLVFLGRHALPIYLIHQPVLFALTFLATRTHMIR